MATTPACNAAVLFSLITPWRLYSSLQNSKPCSCKGSTYNGICAGSPAASFSVGMAAYFLNAIVERGYFHLQHSLTILRVSAIS